MSHKTETCQLRRRNVRNVNRKSISEQSVNHLNADNKQKNIFTQMIQKGILWWEYKLCWTCDVLNVVVSGHIPTCTLLYIYMDQWICANCLGMRLIKLHDLLGCLRNRIMWLSCLSHMIQHQLSCISQWDDRFELLIIQCSSMISIKLPLRKLLNDPH